jgi:tetratricopeptide (TPR) repeat protein
MYTNHNIHFIWFGAQIEGREKLAMEAARKLATREPPEVIDAIPMIQFVVTLPAATLARFGRWDEVLAEPLPEPRWRYATAVAYYNRGLALLAKGDVAGANVARDSVRAIADATPADFMISTNYAQPLLRIATAALDGEIAGAEKRWDDAAARFAEAIAGEDRLKYDEPPTWSMPVRYRAGQVMLSGNRLKDAERLFREDLRRHPENGWSLKGLADTQKAMGQSRAAAATEARFKKAWARADVQPSALNDAR